MKNGKWESIIDLASRSFVKALWVFLTSILEKGLHKSASMLLNIS